MRVNHLVSVANRVTLPVWKEAAPRILKFIQSDNYSVVVPDDEVDDFKAATPRGFDVLGESLIVGEIIPELRSRVLKVNPDRLGWYLQQFIKLKFVMDHAEGERFLIWDADTVPLKKLEFFDCEGKPKYFTGTDFHEPYFSFIGRLLTMNKVCEFSFIAQNFPVTRSQLSSFRSTVEKKHSSTWWRALLNLIDFRENSGFSEYETLGTYISNVEGPITNLQTEPWHRSGWSFIWFRNISHASSIGLRKGYSFFAFEAYDFSNKIVTLGNHISSCRASISKRLKRW
jgi:hypothetical protein